MGSDRVSALTRRRARLLSDAARAALNRPPVAGDTSTPLRTMVVGLDPIRILLFGSGPLIGYGVRTRKHAIDGALAQLLAQRTGRGIIMETRVRVGLSTEDAVNSLGGAGTATFAGGVWAPRFSEEMRHPTPEQCRSSIRSMLHRFRERSEIPLVLCQLPQPLGDDWRTALRRPRVAAFNAILTAEAALVPGVTSVALGTYRPTDPASTPASWHRTQAEHIAPVLLTALKSPDSSTLTSVRIPPGRAPGTIE